MRIVRILMDENDFTEEKLRDLMEHFREEHQEPNMLVMLYSKVEQYNQAQMGHADVAIPSKSYARGILIYWGYDQVIRFKEASERDLRTIVVNGIDPFR